MNIRFWNQQLLDRETRREKVIEAKNRELRLKIKSLRNTNIETEYSGGNSRIDENSDSKNLSTGANDTMILHCEQEYENVIDAELARQAATDQEEVNDKHVLTNGISN